MVAPVLPPVVAIGAAAALRSGAVVQAPGPAGTLDNETAVVRAFEWRVNQYATLHRVLEGPLPPLQVAKDIDTVRAAVDAFAKRILAARPDARQGDLITADAARIFRRRIAASLPREELEAVLPDTEPTRDGKPTPAP
jgi:hypothetical protein